MEFTRVFARHPILHQDSYGNDPNFKLPQVLTTGSCRASLVHGASPFVIHKIWIITATTFKELLEQSLASKIVKSAKLALKTLAFNHFWNSLFIKGSNILHWTPPFIITRLWFRYQSAKRFGT